MSDLRRNRLALLAITALVDVTMMAWAQASPPERLAVVENPTLDLSGKKRVGKASFYAQMFAGRKMADGKLMNPQHNNAASRTLPLGTTAKVTNLETGKSAFVTIQDRGPYVKGRIVDLSPSTAQKIGITPRQGVAKVEVAPLTVPLPNGAVKLGAAAEPLPAPEATLASQATPTSQAAPAPEAMPPRRVLFARNDRAYRRFQPIAWQAAVYE